MPLIKYVVYHEKKCISRIYARNILYCLRIFKDYLFLLSTFLDSNFGLDYFDSETKIVVKQKVKNLVLAVVSSKNNDEEKV